MSATTSLVNAVGSDEMIPADFDIEAPGFIDRWRAMSAVQARVLATSISDMRLEALDATSAPGLSNLRLHLRWSGDSVDGAIEASAMIEAPRPSTRHSAPSPQTKQQEYKP